MTDGASCTIFGLGISSQLSASHASCTLAHTHGKRRSRWEALSMWSNVMVMSITCSPWLHVTSYNNPRTPCRIQKAQPETRKKTPTPPLTSHPTHHHTRRCIACGCILSPPAIGNNGLVASLISRIFLIRLLLPRQSTAHKFHSSDKTHLTGNCSLSCSLHNIPTTFSRPFA